MESKPSLSMPNKIADDSYMLEARRKIFLEACSEVVEKRDRRRFAEKEKIEASLKDWPPHFLFRAAKKRKSLEDLGSIIKSWSDENCFTSMHDVLDPQNRDLRDELKLPAAQKQCFLEECQISKCSSAFSQPALLASDFVFDERWDVREWMHRYKVTSFRFFCLIKMVLWRVRCERFKR